MNCRPSGQANTSIFITKTRELRGTNIDGGCNQHISLMQQEFVIRQYGKSWKISIKELKMNVRLPDF